ncbi:Salicylate carboxymethyltransferase [Handroanthus impetiginosus]|uniref:Salicylate carboxymethyltransferase n=1 Tax=Handroanthus impetiginosus TaxID=429701 RepID=A0A2G9HGR2_9LAMI|nr:Salicylate carboxymethyltransferase [Handroanthus impetiginosus]
MEVERVLHMNGGLGEISYANNSLVQRKVISLTKAITEEAISEVYSSIGGSKSLCVAELGCSTGPNTLFVAAELVKIVHKLSRKQGHDQLPEFQIHLNDLPGNDFNSIFLSLLPLFQVELLQELGPGFGPCFLSAVPGSFYGRLFPAKTLHFVHSSYSLMWLSKVPEGLEVNKDNIYMASTSPANVINAYYEQFQRDFSTFLKCRSEEVVEGGRMVLTILGRKSENASAKECCYIWELLALSLKEMVSQGVIEEEKLHSFNIPQYTPSPAEVKMEVEKEGSFTINRLEVSEITWASCGNGFCTQDHLVTADDHGYNVAKCMRSVAEPLLVEHFGQFEIDKLFDNYSKILSDRMSKEDTKFINVTVSMTRRQ